MNPTIYHNPRCSKSRQTLQLLRDQGYEPVIVQYLDTPVDEPTLTMNFMPNDSYGGCIRRPIGRPEWIKAV